MARELQDRVLELVDAVTGSPLAREVCPDWLRRPGRAECGDLWPTIEDIYAALTGLQLPDEMPPRERRSIDAVLVGADGRSRIVEVDEAQHFSPPRALTLDLYPANVTTAYDPTVWHERSAAATKLRGGGWGKAKPPLFPEDGGRHLQRAFRDALADLLPGIHNWAPTLRIGDFEVAPWIHDSDAVDRMRTLLAEKSVSA